VVFELDNTVEVALDTHTEVVEGSKDRLLVVVEEDMWVVDKEVFARTDIEDIHKDLVVEGF
tara:strand:+ start:313 stop:495 length:183 start_codon:yes stop_codon:yes gene_type:complete